MSPCPSTQWRCVNCNRALVNGGHPRWADHKLTPPSDRAGFSPKNSSPNPSLRSPPPTPHRCEPTLHLLTHSHALLLMLLSDSQQSTSPKRLPTLKSSTLSSEPISKARLICTKPTFTVVPANVHNPEALKLQHARYDFGRSSTATHAIKSWGCWIQLLPYWPETARNASIAGAQHTTLAQTIPAKLSYQMYADATPLPLGCHSGATPLTPEEKNNWYLQTKRLFIPPVQTQAPLPSLPPLLSSHSPRWCSPIQTKNSILFQKAHNRKQSQQCESSQRVVAEIERRRHTRLCGKCGRVRGMGDK